MTRTAKRLAVGLTVIALASSFGVVPPVEASGEAAHQPPISASGVDPGTTGNETTDAATEPQSIDTDTRITDSIDEGETKRYEFTVEEGRTIRVVHNDVAYPAIVTLYGPGGEALARDTTRSKYRRPFGATAERNGTYTLDVRSERGTTYEFQVETIDPDSVAPGDGATAYENASNDDRETALEIDGNGTELTGVLAEGEEDWYAVDLEAGERLDVTLSHELAGPGDGAFAFDLGNGLQVDVLDANGRDVGQLAAPANSTGSDWSEYDEATQTALADEAGTYYVRVSNSSYLGGFAEYDLTVGVTDSAS